MFLSNESSSLFTIYTISPLLIPTNPRAWTVGCCELSLVVSGKAPCFLPSGFSLLQQRHIGLPKSQLLERWMMPSWSSDYFWFLVTNKDPLFHWHRNLIHVTLMGLQWQRYVWFRVFPGTPWPLKKKKIICNNLKFLFIYPLKKKWGTPSKKLGTPSNFFYAKQTLN